MVMTYSGGENPPQHVPNYLIPSIIATICCCLPFGIPAIVFSAQANGKRQAGDYTGALESARKAKIWLIVAVVAVVINPFNPLLSAIAIPSLLRSRMSANEAAAIGSLKTIAAAQTDYNNNTAPHTYTGSLACLGSGNGAGGISFVDPATASGLKSGYHIEMSVGGEVPMGNDLISLWAWSATAWPVVYESTGVRTFYIDETGIIRGSDIGGDKADDGWMLPSID